MTENDGYQSGKHTAQRVLDVAQDLIQRKGYNAISLNDIALVVGIKKPSILHHFSSKAVLGKALVERYRAVFVGIMTRIESDSNATAYHMFESYCSPFVSAGQSLEKICLCAAFAGEFRALPTMIQHEVGLFFDEHLQWMQGVMERGLAQGEFHFQESPTMIAMHIIDSLQGALIVQRATQNSQHVEYTIKMLSAKLLNKSC